MYQRLCVHDRLLPLVASGASGAAALVELAQGILVHETSDDPVVAASVAEAWSVTKALLVIAGEQHGKLADVTCITQATAGAAFLVKSESDWWRGKLESFERFASAELAFQPELTKAAKVLSENPAPKHLSDIFGKFT